MVVTRHFEASREIGIRTVQEESQNLRRFENKMFDDNEKLFFIIYFIIQIYIFV